MLGIVKIKQIKIPVGIYVLVRKTDSNSRCNSDNIII